MKNFDSILAAYLIGWGIFFVYFVTVARRTSELRKEVDRLKEQLKQGK